MTSPHRGSQLGNRFGPYELRSLIGTGRMGEVYRAYDASKGRMVAVEQLRGELAADQSFQERFARECRLAARLQEPHVIPVHDFGRDRRRAVHRHAPGRRRQPERPDPPAWIAGSGAGGFITAQVASALDAAHADGLVHRDVKPENVLLTADHFAYLVDFGLAHASGDPSVTAATGSLIGPAPTWRPNGSPAAGSGRRPTCTR